MKTVCIVCGSAATRPVLQIDALPVYCNVLHATRKKALAAALGDIALHYCEQCDHLFNASFDADLLRYTPAYDASLHHSPHFRAYAEQQADYLLQRYQLDAKRVVEIACGKGEFLRLLADKCNGKFVGFDPSFMSEGTLAENVRVVSDYFDASVHLDRADLIICRQALEHIEQPTAFLKRIAASLPGSRTTRLYFEVPNALYSIRDLSIWDFIYEHVSYFSPHSLQACFSAAGFAVVAVRETYGGQYLCIECEYPAAAGGAAHERTAGQYIQRLGAAYVDKLAYWSAALQREPATTVLWGAGSKGVTFVNLLTSARAITHVVDLNPHKQNKYIAGSGQRVIGSEQLLQLAVQRVLVMNPLYVQEITTMLGNMGLAAEVVAVQTRAKG